MSEDKAIENIINLSIDSNQSKNFFSRLQQSSVTKPQITPVVAESTSTSNVTPVVAESTSTSNVTPVVEESTSTSDVTPVTPVVAESTSTSDVTPVVAESTSTSDVKPVVEESDTVNFLNKINSTQKIMGHNKFQQKIEDLERELAMYKKYNTEQDMKINLFKKTITNLQTQLQEKSNQISSSQTNDTTIYTEQINNLTSNLELKTKENETLLKKLNLLEKDMEYKILDFEKVYTEYISAIDKISEIKQLYAALDSSYQGQVNDIQKNKNIIKELENRLNLEATIKSNLETELGLLKKEVSEYRNNINNIKLEKDNEITLLMEKINNMILPKEIQIEEEHIVKKETPSIIGRSRRGSRNRSRRTC
jgi:hypothetical protein